MKIEKVPLGQLTPDPDNAKEHTPKQIAQIKASIERFGNNDPIAVWGKDNLIVEGHGRYEALKALGYKEAEIIRLDRLTDEERRAYALAHNQLTMNTGWLDGILEKNLDAIESIDMADFGFDVTDGVQEFAEIDDEGLGATTGFDNVLSFGKTKVLMTDEEHKKLRERYDAYVEDNGVSIGFVFSLLGEDSDV